LTCVYYYSVSVEMYVLLYGPTCMTCLCYDSVSFGVWALILSQMTRFCYDSVRWRLCSDSLPDDMFVLRVYPIWRVCTINS
jgi:hypothetical protein